MKHWLSPGTFPLRRCLERLLSEEAARAPHLMEIGAVYLNRKRTQKDALVRPGDYLRIHLDPKRFPAEGIDWNARILDSQDDYLILNKPPGIPVHATLDNARENVVRLLGDELGLSLFITHRLDTASQGLLVLAKTPEFQTTFNDALQRREVEKRYRALVNRKPSKGSVVHFMRPTNYCPKELSETETEGWLRCELEITSVTPFGSAWEVEILLITGRTHQIRCQMAALGFPLINDTIYPGPLVGGDFQLPPHALALQAASLQFQGKHYDLERSWIL